MKRAQLTSLLTAIALSAPASALAQCVMCRESMEAASREPGQGNPALGFHWGVLFLLGSLALLIASAVGLFAYAARGVGSASARPSSEPASAAGTR